MSYLGQLVAVSAVVMGIAQTVTRERLFESLRNRLGGQNLAGFLISCPYCASHWVAFVLVPLTGIYGIRVQVRWGGDPYWTGFSRRCWWWSSPPS